MNPTEDKSIVEAAKILLRFTASLDPLWADSIRAMKAERGYDDLQALGVLVAHTLETGAHMWAPQHPFFDDKHAPAGSRRPCQQCNKPFILSYPGQPLCSNECAEAYYHPKPKVEPVSAAELLAVVAEPFVPTDTKLSKKAVRREEA